MKNVWQHTIIAIGLTMSCLSSKAEQPDASYVLGPGAGLTLDTIQRMVNESAEKWIATPHIEVKVARKRPAQVYILGAAKHPGVFNPPESTGKIDNANGKHLFTVSSAVEMAGGLTESADIRHIHVTRLHPKQVIDIDLWEIMHNGDVTENLILQAGDVIYIPKYGTEYGGTEPSQIKSVEGEIRLRGVVRKPGLFTLTKDTNKVMSLITRAGGFVNPSVPHRIMVAHTNRNGSFSSQIATVDEHGSADSDISLRPGDLVIVTLNKESLPSERPTSRLGDFGPLNYPKWTQIGVPK
jgi:polysaccharide biosynthesis/export protein